jgi:hypothetical protein
VPIEEMFGPKVSNNGYRYDRKVPPKIAKGIQELYTKVIRNKRQMDISTRSLQKI